MKQFYRSKNRIIPVRTEKGETLPEVEVHSSINKAKRRSRELQKQGVKFDPVSHISKVTS